MRNCRGVGRHNRSCKGNRSSNSSNSSSTRSRRGSGGSSAGSVSGSDDSMIQGPGGNQGSSASVGAKLRRANLIDGCAAEAYSPSMQQRAF